MLLDNRRTKGKFNFEVANWRFHLTHSILQGHFGPQINYFI